MAGKLWVPSTILLAVALILSVLVSLSLPFLQFMDIARVSSPQEVFRNALKEVRFGIWSACSWTRDNARECSPRGAGYMVEIRALDPKEIKFETITITAAWTRGLAAHPIATGFIASALLASLSSRHSASLYAPLITALAALIIVVVFAIQLALYLHVKVRIGGALDGANTAAGPGLWLTLSSLVLVLVSTALLFMKRRREVQEASGYPMLSNQNKGVKGFMGLFRKN